LAEKKGGLLPPIKQKKKGRGQTLLYNFTARRKKMKKRPLKRDKRERV